MIATSAVTHGFEEQLRYSHSCEDWPCWGEIYRKAFPTMIAMHSHRGDGQHQRAGIDRSIILSNSKQILVDEKSRKRENTGDILIEFISNDVRNTPGWAVKELLADYIAYAFIPSGIAYLMPVVQMQAAWARNSARWISTYKTKAAQNDGYRTISCPVETWDLMTEISRMLVIQFTPIQR